MRDLIAPMTPRAGSIRVTVVAGAALAIVAGSLLSAANAASAAS